MIKPRWKFLSYAELINHWQDITPLEEAEKHYKQSDLTKVKSFTLFHRHVNETSTEITS